jgi:fido (protein-threonine AMPylation protein)
MKYAGDRGDPYLDKDTGVLRNLLGIKNQAALDEAESSLSFLRTSELREQPVQGSLDLSHLQVIHQRLFCDVYDWAGQLRLVEIQKGNTDFARHTVIQSAARQLFGQLAKEQHLHGLDADQFSMKLKFKKQAYQTNAVDAVADCFAGQPKREGLNYRMDPGRAVDASGQTLVALESPVSKMPIWP